MSDNTVKMHYQIPGNDFAYAGEASSSVKKVLGQLGVNPVIVKRITIAMYEAEINAVIHAGGGTADVEISENEIIVYVRDNGPGIADIELAMQEGFSTASDDIRELGFGAGMGLPNMKRHTDRLEIVSEVGKGTTVMMLVSIKN